MSEHEVPHYHDDWCVCAYARCGCNERGTGKCICPGCKNPHHDHSRRRSHAEADAAGSNAAPNRSPFVAVPTTGTYLVKDGRIIENATCGEGCTGWDCAFCERTDDDV